MVGVNIVDAQVTPSLDSSNTVTLAFGGDLVPVVNQAIKRMLLVLWRLVTLLMIRQTTVANHRRRVR
jgi:hypothetical protein